MTQIKTQEVKQPSETTKQPSEKVQEVKQPSETQPEQDKKQTKPNPILEKETEQTITSKPSLLDLFLNKKYITSENELIKNARKKLDEYLKLANRLTQTGDTNIIKTIFNIRQLKYPMALSLIYVLHIFLVDMYKNRCGKLSDERKRKVQNELGTQKDIQPLEEANIHGSYDEGKRNDIYDANKKILKMIEIMVDEGRIGCYNEELIYKFVLETNTILATYRTKLIDKFDSNYLDQYDEKEKYIYIANYCNNIFTDLSTTLSMIFGMQGNEIDISEYDNMLLNLTDIEAIKSIENAIESKGLNKSQYRPKEILYNIFGCIDRFNMKINVTPMDSLLNKLTNSF